MNVKSTLFWSRKTLRSGSQFAKGGIKSAIFAGKKKSLDMGEDFIPHASTCESIIWVQLRHITYIKKKKKKKKIKK